MLCAHMRVDHDQSAEVPIWWTHLQVQRAVIALTHLWAGSPSLAWPVFGLAAFGRRL